MAGGVDLQKKAVKDNAKKSKILSAATNCFMEDGFEGTSIRKIMNEAGAEVGLFYYYFKSKDDIYSAFIESLFIDYRIKIIGMTEKAVRSPYTSFIDIFGLFADEAERFRNEFVGKMHESTLRDIRDRSLEISVPYIKQIIEVLIEYGAKPLISTEELAIIMTYGIGNLFLRDKESRLAGTDTESMKTTALLFGLDLDYVSLTLPRTPAAEEAEKITALAELCSENFADYNAERMARLIKKRMSSGEIFVIAHKNNIAGFIMFSKKNKTIDHIAVSPDYRRIGIASRLMVTAMAQFEVGEELSAVTFRQEHLMSDGVSRMYKKFGFDDEKNIVVRGEPLVRRTVDYNIKCNTKKYGHHTHFRVKCNYHKTKGTEVEYEVLYTFYTI